LIAYDVPSNPNIEPGDVGTLAGSRAKYEATKDAYAKFTSELLERVALL
jgi:hypothetical protein